VAGTGELLPTMINLSISLGLASNVMFLGRISEQDSRRIYAIADLYVMPSMSEPFGITALEALSSATPIMISKTSGVSEVVRTAVKVDFWDIDGMANKMIAILKFDTLRKAMSAHGTTEAKRLTWDKTAQSTLMVYHELLGY
ncbi:MAG TPA: glycosyltransferase, partial [Candidatus Micrarchaeota archaeon]|nr:glycosyltransferase [Candidatus Micrarchaeota archaeon]